MDGGYFLFKFILDVEKLPIMSPGIVWEFLYVRKDPHFPCRLDGEEESTDK